MENAKIIIELYNEDSRFGITSENSVNKKAAAGISRLISEKAELQVKYDRLLKDYELARHECKQKTEHIGKLEEKQEELLTENHALREVIADYEERIQTYAKRTALFVETIDGIRKLIDGK